MAPPNEQVQSMERRGNDLYERIAKLETQLLFGERISRMEQQIGRLVSDYESEKGTRARVNIENNLALKEIDKRIRSIERNLYIAAGAIVAADYLFRMLVK